MSEDLGRAIAVAFGRRVAAARHARGMTQSELAQGLGVTQQYISLIESGAENLTLMSMSRIASQLGIDLSDMLKPLE